MDKKNANFFDKQHWANRKRIRLISNEVKLYSKKVLVFFHETAQSFHKALTFFYEVLAFFFGSKPQICSPNCIFMHVCNRGVGLVWKYAHITAYSVPPYSRCSKIYFLWMKIRDSRSRKMRKILTKIKLLRLEIDNIPLSFSIQNRKIPLFFEKISERIWSVRKKLLPLHSQTRNDVNRTSRSGVVGSSPGS